MTDPNGLHDLDWSSMTRVEHTAAFAALRACHAEAMSRVRIKDGHDNTDILDFGIAINRAMHAANDDLARREAAALEGDLSVLR